MYSCTAAELPFCCENLITADSHNFKMLDISDLFNEEISLLQEDVLIDGGRFWENENISLYKIPFQVKTDGKNMIAPPPPPPENEEEILNFGVPAKRRKCRPVSRDGLTEICVNEKVKELFFIMHIKGLRHQRWGFATDGTILGPAGGDVTSPLFIDDVEGFMVEIVYRDHKTDTALPYNIDIGRHGVQRDMRVYAVPADGSMVEKVIFHNRKLDTDISVVAVTVNNTDERLIPNMLIPELPEKITHVVSSDKKMELSGNMFNIKNGAISMSIDTSHGLKLIAMQNEYVPEFKVKPDYMLKFRDEDGTIIETFEKVEAVIEGQKAIFTYKQKALLIKVFFEYAGTNNIRCYFETENQGKNAYRTGMIFPVVSGIEYTDHNDGWYFFPKLQNIHSNETVFIYEESAPSFPKQFMDVYSPKQQGGLSLTTQERETVVRKYALEKDEDGISFYVEYPAMYGELQAGEKFVGSPTLLTAHEGDWRASFEIYVKWLDSWYEPYKCQDKQWYRECFWLLAEIRDFFESKEFTKSPVWYDTEKKEFNFRKVLEEQKELSGCYPDILHLWGWTVFKENSAMQWGNFGTTDYDYYGGRECFKNALHDIKDNLGLQVSLYLHPTLLTDCYPQAEKFYPKHRVINDTGEFITQLKEAMPENVVLYGEYEAVDINARYIDCNISYYIIDSIMDMIRKDAIYYDAWNDKALEYEVVDGFAELYLTIDAQHIGCIEIK